MGRSSNFLFRLWQCAWLPNDAVVLGVLTTNSKSPEACEGAK